MSCPVGEIRFRAEVEHRHDGEALLEAPGDAVLVQRGRPRSFLIACPDGCGDTLAVNLDPRSGKAWRFYRKGDTISLSPSVWREGGCESHFILWRGRILWCDARFAVANREPVYDPALEEELLSALDPVRFQTTHELAEQLDEIPWDVSSAARNLVVRGLAEYEAGAQRESIRRKPVRQPAMEQPREPGLLARLLRFLFRGAN